ncbi:hypothetical protein GCM10022215_29010 [Nocardioides fonticola]|uniref:DUF2029 domain-containing protein n=1 Tax=Nocardioides fonticola TaxID=450363 RepID=A0ABP7XNP3_9ACTN
MKRGVLGSTLVLLGGLLISVLPASTPLLRFAPLVALRDERAGRMLGLAVVVIGLGLCASAWLRLCREVAGATGPAARQALTRVCTAAVLWSLPLLVAPPLFSRDGWSYAAQGTMVEIGISPYDYGPWVLGGPIVEAVDPVWMYTRTPYGPLPLGLGALAAAHTRDPWLLVIAHRLIALVGLALLAWAVPRLAAWTRADVPLAGAIVLASPLMLANGVAGLHNDLLMIGLMAAALVVAVERSWLWGAALGGAAAAVKLPGGLVCLAIVLVALPAGAGLRARISRAVSVAGVSLGTVVALGLVVGVGVGWVRGLAVPVTFDTVLSPPTVLGNLLDWLVATLLPGPGWGRFGVDALRHLALLATAVILIGLGVRTPTGDRVAALRALAIAMVALVVLSPVVHPWYLLWPLPFAAALALPRGAWHALMAVAVVGGVAAPLDSTLYDAYVAVSLASLLIAAISAALLVTRRARARMERLEDVRHGGGERGAVGAGASFPGRPGKPAV